MNPLEIVSLLAKGVVGRDRAKAFGVDYDERLAKAELDKKRMEMQNAITQHSVNAAQAGDETELSLAMDEYPGEDPKVALARYRTKTAKDSSDYTKRMREAELGYKNAESVKALRPPKPAAPHMQDTASGPMQFNEDTGRWEPALDAGGKPLKSKPPASTTVNLNKPVSGRDLMVDESGNATGYYDQGGRWHSVGGAPDGRGRKTPRTAGERNTIGEQQTTLQLLDSVEKLPDLDSISGPMADIGGRVRESTVGAALGMKEPSSSYLTAKASLGTVRDNAAHAISGAAVTVPEMGRLMQHLPDISQRTQMLRTNIRITRAAVLLSNAVLTGEMSPEEAAAEVTKILQGSDNTPVPSGGAAPSAGPRVIRYDGQGKRIQ
jgi:hypothetical protein